MGTRLLQRLVIPAFMNTIKSSCPKFILGSERVICANTVNLNSIRNYAKSKDKGKDKKGKGKDQKVEVNLAMISEFIPVDKMKERCNSAIEKLKDDFAKNLSLRSTTGAIESLPVKLDGKEYELQELAQILRKNPSMIVMNFASFPQAIPNALKAIHASGLNLNPQQNGTTLYLPVPKVTKEHREALAKNAKSLYITCRDAVKDIQNEYLKKLKKQTGVSEDKVLYLTKQINVICEEYQLQAKSVYEAKHNELVGK